MDSQQQQASERIRQANNILVTVSSNPSVDQLAACIGLTISLNKMGKHATAVFSGNVPSTLEFLQPEKTIEKNTDSLRDFIIALDKSKADKLRYKVEDRVVKIFITPYRTSITDKDLEFSQGDFNVDVIVALGVHNQEELDLAITSHGRILHDATVITLNTQPGGELGSINWLNPNASSLSELGVQLVNSLDKTLIDGQVATAFLTGIVSETERFSNNKTSPQTMSISAQLMSSGANQQLVATKLEEPVTPPPSPVPSVPIAAQAPDEGATEPTPVKKTSDGTLEIAHDETKTAADEEAEEDRQEAEAVTEHAEEPKPLPPAPQIQIDEHGSLSPVGEHHEQSERRLMRPDNDERELEDLLPPAKHDKEPTISHHSEAPKMILEPPMLGGELTANASPGQYNENEKNAGGLPTEEEDRPSGLPGDMSTVGPTIMPPHDEEDDINAPGTSFLGDQPLLDKDGKPESADKPDHVSLDNEAGKTLTDIERDVHSSHVADDGSKTDTPAEDQHANDTFTPPAPPAQPMDNPLPSVGNPFAAAPPAPVRPDPIVSAFTPPTATPASDTMLPPVSTVTPNNGFTPPANDFPPIESTPSPANENLSIPDMPIPGADNAAPAAASNPNTSLDDARNAVAKAMGGGDNEPIQGLNAQPLGTDIGNGLPDQDGNLPGSTPAATPDLPPAAPVQPWTPTPAPTTPPPAGNFGPAPQYGSMPPAPAFAPQGPAPAYNGYQDPSAPPSVPPPMMPPMPPR